MNDLMHNIGANFGALPFAAQTLIIVGIVLLASMINIVVQKKTGKMRNDEKPSAPWMFLFIVMIALTIVAALLSVPAYAHLMMSRELLEETHHYTSGNSMDGYEAVFWVALIVYGIVIAIVSSIFIKK